MVSVAMATLVVEYVVWSVTVDTVCDRVVREKVVVVRVLVPVVFVYCLIVISVMNLTKFEELNSSDMFLELGILRRLEDHVFRARLVQHVPNQ